MPDEAAEIILESHSRKSAATKFGASGLFSVRSELSGFLALATGGPARNLQTTLDRGALS